MNQLSKHIVYLIGVAAAAIATLGIAFAVTGPHAEAMDFVKSALGAWGLVSAAILAAMILIDAMRGFH